MEIGFAWPSCNEAIRALQCHLQQIELLGQRPKPLEVITGRGKHSRGAFVILGF